MSAAYYAMNREFWESKMGDWYVPEPNTGCWLWMKGVGSQGYGICGGRLARQYAHRAAYTLLRGPIPDDLQIDHLCRTRSCVNPDHMEPVTARVNLLRGESPAARQAKQTHCKRGHEFTPDNTYHFPNSNQRMCRTCHRAKSARQREQRREK